MLGRKRIDRQHGLQADKRPELLRGTGQELAVLLHHRARVLEVPEYRAGIDRLHGMSLEQKAGDDPEISTAAAQAPEEIGVLRLAGSHDLAAGEHDIGLDEVIDGEAVLARQISHAATQRQAGDAGGGHNAEGNGEPVGMSGVVDIARRATSLDADGLARGIDAYALHGGQVDHQPIVDAAKAGPVVPAATYGNPETMLAAEVDRGDHVAYVHTPGDHQRPLVDHGVEEFACLVVVGIGPLDQPTPKVLLELNNGLRLHDCLRERLSKREADGTEDRSGVGDAVCSAIHNSCQDCREISAA